MVRPANSSSVFYAPAEPPTDAAELQRFLREEFLKLSAAINALAAGQLEETAVAPPKPRAGNVRLADGVNWSPGAGPGVYCYYGGAWHFLG